MKLLDDIFIAFCILIIGALIWFVLLTMAFGVQAPTTNYADMPTIQGNSLIAISPMPFNKPIVLSAIFEKICFCESSNNPNAFNPKSGATGLFQVIPSSERFCEKGLGKEMDMFNPEDNIECANYLMEHGGLAHWAASIECWSN